MTSSSHTRLYSEGKGFSLPHTDLEAMVAECALRAADVDFTNARPNANFSGDQLPAVYVKASTPQTSTAPAKTEDLATRGAMDTFGLLARNGKDLNSGLSNDQLLFVKAAGLSFLHQALPAYDFITLALEEHYAVRQSNSVDPNSLVAYGLGRLGWGRRGKLAGIEATYRISSLSSALSTASASLKAIEEALRVISTHKLVAPADAGKGFAFSTAAPTQFDCLAFGIGSVFLLAEFDGAYGELRTWQAEQRNEVPRLLALTEAVRSALFSGTSTNYFSLKPILPSADSSAYDADKPFREGRLRFLALTAAFAGLYFIVTNAATLVQVLEQIEGGEDEDEDDE